MSLRSSIRWALAFGSQISGRLFLSDHYDSWLTFVKTFLFKNFSHCVESVGKRRSRGGHLGQESG